MDHRFKRRWPSVRRAKQRPCEDFWHTIRWGGVIAALLFLFLPKIM